MRRRKFVIGAGALFAGSAAAMGTGAFTSATAGERTVEIQDTSDENGLLALGPAGFSDNTESDYPNSVYVETEGAPDGDSNDIVKLDFIPDDDSSLGFNEESVYYIDEALEIHLNEEVPVDQSYTVRMEDNINGLTPYTGTTDGDDRKFQSPDANRDIGSHLGTLAPGESILVGFKIETNGDNFFGGSSLRVTAQADGSAPS
jgi:hypothetical protein